MEVKLHGKIKKGATIIEGFPGFGLVGTIVTEYLIEHLEAKEIGSLWSDKIPSIVALHEGKIVEPLAIFYDEKHNIVFLRAIASVTGIEWDLAEATSKLANDVQAKEIISIEGVSGIKEKTAEPGSFYYSNNPENQKKFEVIGIKKLNEGIVVGVTASLLSKVGEATFLFVESYSDLPDSRAAAKLIEVLDKYLGLKVDYKPLIEKAEKFEGKVREFLSKSTQVVKEKEKKDSAAYFG